MDYKGNAGNLPAVVYVSLLGIVLTYALVSLEIKLLNSHLKLTF